MAAAATLARASARFCSLASQKRLFSPRSHLWVGLTRDTPLHGGLAPPRASWKLSVGITERGFEDIGSLTGLTALVQTGAPVALGQPLLRLAWEGHKISDGDELYHTTWQNIEGEFMVTAPVAGTLVSLHEGAYDASSRPMELDATDCLAVLHVDRPALQSAPGLVDAGAYRAHLQTLEPGMFGGDGYGGSFG